MDYLMLNKLVNLFSNDNISVNELLSSLYVLNVEEALDVIDEFVCDNCDELLMVDNFYRSYYMFMYTLIGLEIDVNKLVNHCIDNLKMITRDYNKNKLSKDIKFFKATSIINDFKTIKNQVKNEKKNSSSLYETIYFIITNLKKCDYLFRLIDLHPEYVNIKNNGGECIFIDLLNYYYANLNILSDEDIKYYKRIFVMFLESDKLALSNDELIYILKISESNLKGKSIKEKENINFIIQEIDNHYEIINQDARKNALDYIDIECPVQIMSRNINTKRKDRTRDFVISIDNLRSNNVDNILIDDTFSIRENSDHSFNIFIHIPDVDYYISKDSKTDKFMRHLGESVYASGNKKSLLPYEVGKMASLSHGIVKPAITFNIHVDNLGNILDINFEKSLINVNYNLSKRDADVFMKNKVDERFECLDKMVKIAKSLRKKRGEFVGKRSASLLIVDEFNILVDIATALYFKENNIIFPYKNYRGKVNKYESEHVNACEEFASKNNLSNDEKNVLYSIFDINNRVYYDTVSIGNKSFNGLDVGNVGNPLREYISLETDRLIKDIVISREDNISYWKNRIEKDIIEYTETSAKIKSLYKKNKV